MAGKFASVLRFKFGRDIDNAVIRLKQALHPMIRTRVAFDEREPGNTFD
jgi:hypothetical protein